MYRPAKGILKLLDVVVIFVMAFGSPMSALAAPSPTGATITSDAADYPPGATVTLIGAGWAQGEVVHIFVNDDVGRLWQLDSGVNGANPDPIADGNGAFTYQFQLPGWFIANYSVTATGAESGTATTTFTDLSIGTYDQCSNDQGTGYTSGDTGCRWINGNLQSNNSIYMEGDATVQRLWLTDLVPGSTHTMRFQYGTTKGGKHAYDFLTTWNWSENWITDADRCQGIDGCETASTESKLDIPQDPSVPNSFEPSAPGARQFVMRGGTLTNATTPAIVSGSYSGDSETAITVTFTVGPSSGAMCTTKQGSTTCGVAIWFGAHVAAQANWGLGLGAGSISGSPYHVALDALDGASVGQRDNQMQAGVVTVIPNGTIIIVKDAIPNDPQDFSFNLNNASTISQNFSLDDDSDPTLPSSQTFSVPPGTWTASELNIPALWTLTNLTCVDPTNNTTVSGAVATINLASNETVTCTYTDTKTVVKDLTITKTAVPSYSRLYGWSIDKSVDQTKVNIADGGTATFNYSVTVTPDGEVDSAWAVTGKITVANSNGFAISGVNVTDAIDNGGVCTVTGGTNVTVPPNGNVQLDYSCSYSVAPTSPTGTNTATATWDKAAAFTPNDTALGTAAVDFGNVTPTETNKTITVVDDKTDPANPVTLGTWSWVDGPHTFTYSLIKSGVAGKCTSYTNTAVIDETKQSASQTVTLCVGKDLTVSKTAAGTFDRAYTWKISKNVDQTSVSIAEGGSYTFHYTVNVQQTGVTETGWTLAGKITVANPNDWEAVTVDVADAVDNGGTCSVTGGTGVSIPAGGSKTLDYICSYASKPTYAGTNTATITWDKAAAFTPDGSASGTAVFTLTQSGTANKTVHVTDSYKGDLGTVTATDEAPFATGTFTYDRTETGVAGKCTTYNNTATITETKQSASQGVTLCVGKDLTISKTAAGTFDRSYLWDISKDVDKTTVNIADGGKATFNYTVNVTQTGITDSGWTLSGKITITNPNDWEDVTLSSLSDTVDNGGSCTVAGGPYVVLKGSSMDVQYSCSFSGAPSSYSGTNTVTATWDKAAYFTPGDNTSGSAPFTLSQLGTTNKTVTVTDSLGGDLGTLTGTDAAPFASKTFTYSQDFSGVGGKCTSYDNTATITETGQAAGKTVTVCVGADLTVSKTAAGSFDRTYLWKISKDVDQTSVNIAAGGSYTFHYTVNVDQTGVTDAGWVLSGVITVTNPNDWEDVTLTGLTDAVNNGGSCTINPGPYTVLAGKTLDIKYTCSFASAPSSYSGTNTATATWDKAAYFTPGDTASGSAPFTLTQLGSTNKTVHVTDSFGGNLGTVTATDSAPFATAAFIYDRTISGVTGTCTTYDNTATIVETHESADKTVNVCVGADLTVTKDATPTFTRTYAWSIAKAVNQTQLNIAAGGMATFIYTVGVTHDGGTDSVWQVAGKITVSNPNDWEAITANVTDTVDNGGSCTVTGGTNVTVPKSGSVVLDYSCTFPSGAGGINTATAAWDQATYFTPNGAASGTATFAFTTPSTIVDGSVTVTDTLGGNLGTVSYTDPSPTYFKYSRDFPGVGGTCTNYNNTATFTTNTTGTTGSASQTVKVCVGLDLTVSKTAAGTFDRTYLWKISKDVDQTLVKIAEGSPYTFHYVVSVEQTGVSDAGWVLAGKITITNPNDWEDITLTSLTDANDNGGSCTVDQGPYTVPAGQSLDVSYSCTYAAAPSSYSGKNTATATWDKAAAFTPSGSASGDKAFTLTQLGSTNKTVHVTDSFGGALGTVTATDSAPFAVATFSYDRTESGVAGKCTTFDNTATITETGQWSSQSATLCIAKDLTVSKTAVPSFTRTYLWDITKDVDKTQVSQASGSVTFNYTVLVTETGFTDSAWKVTGTITVSNPNDWESITVNVADSVDNGGQCVVANGTGVTIPASGSKTFNYTCTWLAKPSSYAGTNTATATWDKAAAFTPSGSASGTQGFTFANPSTVNKTVTVTDTFNGTTQTLGTVTATDTAPFATKTFTYSYIVPVPDAACKSYTNTARIVETGQMASKTVTVCKASMVTDTMLCSLPNNQFKLVFTPDQANGWKLNASNPGQFYYNMFYSGPGGVDVTATLPYPFVTQGAVPIHVYSNVSTYTGSGGTTCLTPSGELANESDQVTLANYGAAYDFTKTTTVTIHVPNTGSPNGFAYINIHLNYGLKGTTGYAKGGSGNDAVKLGTSTILIADLKTYVFSDTAGGTATITSINSFKKDPGIGGLVLNGTGDPVVNAKVLIYQGTKLMATVYTDDDGWYMWQYKWTGKAATFTVKMTPRAPYAQTTQTATVTLKANGYLVVNFTVLK